METGGEIINREVPMDIRDFEAKMFGPFTVRQAICLFIVAVIDITLYTLVLKQIGVTMDTMVYILGFLDVPFLAFGWIKIDNMHLEKYIKHVIIPFFSSPAKRKARIMVYKKPKVTFSSAEMKESQKRMKNVTEPEFKGYE